jgi:hypothetical protein
MAAYCVDARPATGQPGDVHTTKSNDLGAVRAYSDGNSYIYLKGVTSCAVGSVVVFQPGVWTAILVATGVKGSVAIATGAVDASTKYGWFTFIGQDVGIARSAIASNVALFAGGVSGSLDDVAVKGDQIMNCMARNAAAGGGDSVILQIDRAFIGMSNESTG